MTGKQIPFTPRTTSTTQTGNKSFAAPKAEAFGNCEAEAGGIWHKIPKGIPLDSNNHVSRSLINAAKAKAEKGEELVLMVRMTVKVVTDDSGKEDLVFG